MQHSRGAPYHPQTQGKIERWHQTLKNRILLENYFFPGDLEAQIEAFVDHYNHQRYHESLNNVTPADVYFGRDKAILKQRERIKLKTFETRRIMPLTRWAELSLNLSSSWCQKTWRRTVIWSLERSLALGGRYALRARISKQCHFAVVSAVIIEKHYDLTDQFRALFYGLRPAVLIVCLINLLAALCTF